MRGTDQVIHPPTHAFTHSPTQPATHHSLHVSLVSLSFIRLDRCDTLAAAVGNRTFRFKRVCDGLHLEHEVAIAWMVKGVNENLVLMLLSGRVDGLSMLTDLP